MKFKAAVFLCVFLSVIGLQQSYAQTLTVTGRVTSPADEPFEGVTVAVQGGSASTMTDRNGNYTITVPSSGSILVFSHVGMKTQQLTVTDATASNMAMVSDGGVLQEVLVNVGYGTQRKSVTTGAISSVKARDLEKVPNGRVEQALQGRVSGVTILQNAGQPGAASTIRVRGITSFGGVNPLWVVDGVAVDQGALGFLNQADIESIEVLKDATSAAIYGTRAAAGVILITTKKGRAGKFNISYNAFYGTSAPAHRLELLNATQYATLMNEKSVAGGGNVLFPDLSIYGTGTDWQKHIFSNDARRYSHEISMSGGTDRSLFYLSFGMQDQEGIVAKQISNFTKRAMRLNTSHKISRVFTFGQTLGYTHLKGVGLGNTNSEYGGPLSSAINLDPITPVIITDPTVAAGNPYSGFPVIRDANGNPYGISEIVGQEMTNPLAYIETRHGGYNWSDDLIGNAYLEAKVTSKIELRSQLNGKLSFWGSQGFTPVYYLSSTNSVLKNNLGKNNNNALDWNIENTIKYSDKIRSHTFDILLGQAAYYFGKGGGSSVNLLDLPINSWQDASFNFDISQANRTSSSYTFTPSKISSLFARGNYNYKEKYLLTAIMRRDGSTRFGANNKYGYFPSASVGWNISKENFWPANKYVKSLKLRGGYGVVGNDQISNFGYLSRVLGGFNYTMGNGGVITTGYSPLTLDNPDLRWEETSQLSIGFDATILNNFSLTVDVYNKKTKDILRNVPIPGYVGVSEDPVANVASMENKGLEIELGYRNTFNKVNFSANGNVSFVKNEVTYVNSDANFIPGEAAFQSMGPVTRIEVGHSYNYFYGYKTAGIFQNIAEVNAYKNKNGGLIQPDARPGDFRWQDIDGDGSITEGDRTDLGTNLPKVTFGLTLNADFMGFDFMAFGQGAAGNKIFQGLRRLDIQNANYQTVALSRWRGEGTSNDYPRLTSNDVNGNFGKMSDFYLQDGDYLRLKVVTIGYSYTNKILNKIGASRLRLYVTGENLLTLTDYTGYDPEIGGGVFGIDKGFYPQARSFLVGAQLQF